MSHLSRHGNKNIWKIPTKLGQTLRKYSFVFTSGDYTFNHRLRIYHMILSPNLAWFKKRLIEQNIVLDEEEAESEVYTMLGSLLKRYDPRKSSIVPYLTIYLPKEIAMVLRKHENWAKVEINNTLAKNISENESYEYPDEIYLHTPGVLFYEKYFIKYLPRLYKYLIFRILTSSNIDTSKLARMEGISRSTMIKHISKLAEILTKRKVKE